MFSVSHEQIILNILHSRTSRLRFCLYNARKKRQEGRQKLQCALQKNTKNLLSEAISTAERRMKENKTYVKYGLFSFLSMITVIFLLLLFVVIVTVSSVFPYIVSFCQRQKLENDPTLGVYLLFVTLLPYNKSSIQQQQQQQTLIESYSNRS